MNELSKKILFTTRDIQVDLNAVNAPFSWETYESYTPDVHTYEVPTQLNQETHNLIKHEKEKLSARQFDMTIDEYEQTKQYISDKNIQDKIKTRQDVIDANTKLRNENLHKLNPGMQMETVFTKDELDTLESDHEVVSSADHSVYASA